MFLPAVYVTLFISANIYSMIIFLTLYTLLNFIISFVIFYCFMFDFMIKFNWINLFSIFVLRTYVIMNAYFFFLLFLTSHFIFFICNLEYMMTLIFFITFASSFLMFCDMILTFTLCIIILNFSQRKVAVITTFLIQKSFDFSIFLLFSEITLNIINFLNFCIFIILLRAVNVIATSNSRVNIIIFFAFIFCICSIF